MPCRCSATASASTTSCGRRTTRTRSRAGRNSRALVERVLRRHPRRRTTRRSCPATPCGCGTSLEPGSRRRGLPGQDHARARRRRRRRSRGVGGAHAVAGRPARSTATSAPCTRMSTASTPSAGRSPCWPSTSSPRRCGGRPWGGPAATPWPPSPESNAPTPKPTRAASPPSGCSTTSATRSCASQGARLAEPVRATFRSFGLDEEQVRDAHRVFSAALRGLVLSEKTSSYRFVDDDHAFAQLVDLFLVALSTGSWPAVGPAGQ